MERIRVELPERLGFCAELEVRIGEVNYGGHLGNDSLFTLLQEARLRFLGQAGFSEKDAGGCGLIQCDAAVRYLAQAFHGERLLVEVGIGEWDRAGFALLYRVRGDGGREVARARTGMAFFDYARGRPARMPAAFRERFLPDARKEG